MTNNYNFSDYKEIYEHVNKDYPLGVYYIEPEETVIQSANWHWHDEIEIDIVREGYAVYTFSDGNLVIAKDTAIILKSNIVHSIQSIGENCKIISVVFSPSLLFPDSSTYTRNMYLNPFNNSAEKYQIFENNDRLGKTIISYLEDIIDYNLSKEFGYEILTKSALCQLWYTLIKDLPRKSERFERDIREQKQSPDDERIKDAISFISKNYSDSITLEDIADSIHISKSECCRLFKRSIDMSPFEYLKRYRILMACDEMLKNQRNDESISTLANNVGFNNASYFNKVFKEYMGCTPSEYKKQSKTERRDKMSPFGMSFSHL